MTRFFPVYILQRPSFISGQTKERSVDIQITQQKWVMKDVAFTSIEFFYKNFYFKSVHVCINKQIEI